MNENLEGRLAELEDRVQLEAGLRASIDRDLSTIATRQSAANHLLQALAITQAEHTATLSTQSETLGRLTTTVGEHSALLDQHTATLDQHTATLDQHTAKLDQHTAQLDQIIGLLEPHSGNHG